jgi:hypothetical protein
MLLTRKMLNKLLRNHRTQIPSELKNQLLEDYGNLVEDEEGHFFEYSEQDICEQLRKILRPYEKDTLNLNRVPF